MSKDKITLQEILNGEFLIRDWFKKQYGLILLISGLIFIYIFMGFQAQRQQHRLTKLQKELQGKHFEQLTIEAELTERTRQSSMSRQLKEHGSELKENQKPVILLR
ncbi:MAG: hypothetical protein MJZ64_04925 [Paludibacteraceae bacterium]|nr:hypothetical protein [Paludibacteraceae bacterium]